MTKPAWNIYHSSNGVKGMYVLGVVTLNFVKERRNKGVSRVYGKVIDGSNSKELGSFMREKIDRRI